MISIWCSTKNCGILLLLLIGLTIPSSEAVRSNYLRGGTITEDAIIDTTVVRKDDDSDLKTTMLQGTEVYEPDGGVDEAVGLTFLLTGFLLSPSDYQTTISLLLSKKQTVIAIPITNAGDDKAIRVRDTFDEYLESNPGRQGLDTYNIIGHSAGGKISLLVAGKYDPLRVRTVIALDPVDDNEPRFTNENADKNVDFNESKADIYMTYTDGGTGIDPNHNAAAIHALNPTTTTVHQDVNSSHLCYCDDGGSFVAKLSRIFYRPKRGDDEAFEHAQEWVRTLI